MAQSGALAFRSFSQLQLLRTCGEQYRLRRIEHHRERPSAAAVGGTVIHSATEVVDHGLADGVDVEEVVQAALGHATNGLDQEIQYQLDKSNNLDISRWKKYGRQDIEWYRTTGIPDGIRAYVKWRTEGPDLQLAEIPNFGRAIEVPFNLHLDGLGIHGYIDRVFTSPMNEGQYYPVDIKSGSKPKTDEQLAIYAMALNQGLSWPVGYGFYVYNLKKGEALVTAPLDLRHWTRERLSKIYRDVTRTIDQGIFIPNPGEACFHCGVTEHCSFNRSVV